MHDGQTNAKCRSVLGIPRETQMFQTTRKLSLYKYCVSTELLASTSSIYLYGFSVHIHGKLLQHTFIMGASSDPGQSFRPRHTKIKGLGWGKNRLSRYDIHAEGVLPPIITNSEIKMFGLLDLQCFS